MYSFTTTTTTTIREKKRSFTLDFFGRALRKREKKDEKIYNLQNRCVFFLCRRSGQCHKLCIFRGTRNSDSENSIRCVTFCFRHSLRTSSILCVCWIKFVNWELEAIRSILAECQRNLKDWKRFSSIISAYIFWSVFGVINRWKCNVVAFAVLYECKCVQYYSAIWIWLTSASCSFPLVRSLWGQHFYIYKKNISYSEYIVNVGFGAVVCAIGVDIAGCFVVGPPRIHFFYVRFVLCAPLRFDMLKINWKKSRWICRIGNNSTTVYIYISTQFTLLNSPPSAEFVWFVQSEHDQVLSILVLAMCGDSLAGFFDRF